MFAEGEASKEWLTLEILGDGAGHPGHFFTNRKHAATTIDDQPTCKARFTTGKHRGGGGGHLASTADQPRALALHAVEPRTLFDGSESRKGAVGEDLVRVNLEIAGD